MSGIADARVLAAFTQGIQRAYMLGVEQRLTQAVNSASTGASSGRLNHEFVTYASTFSTTSSTEVDVTGMSLNITTTGGALLVLASAQIFRVTVGASGGSGEFGFVVNGGAAEWVWIHDVPAANTNPGSYGLAAIRAFDVAAGTHTVKGVARSQYSQTLSIQAGSDWPMFLMAVEL